MLSILFDGPSKRAGAFFDGFSFVQTGAGTRANVYVSEDTALNYAAVWCATRVIAETIGSLPAVLYRKLPDNGREQATDHPLFDILKLTPNEDMGSTVFREGRAMHQINWGNGFAEIERDGDMVVALHPIHPSRVRLTTKQDQNRGLYYRVRNDDNEEVHLRKDEMLHIPGVLSEDGIWGKGVIQYARESIGGAIKVDRHGYDYFGSGAQPKGILITPGMKDPEQRRSMRSEWRDLHGSNSGEIAIFPPDTTYSPISISNEDSQFLETKKHNVNDFARWYRIPAHMLGDLERATHSNIEQQSIDFVIYSILPWVRKWEEELTRKLLSEDERHEYFIEFNFAGLLRGDIMSRMSAYKIALETGIMTLNEVRRLENLPGIGPAGDQNFVQLNMTTAQRMLESPDVQQSGAMTDEQAKAMFDAWTRGAVAQQHPHDSLVLAEIQKLRSRIDTLTMQQQEGAKFVAASRVVLVEALGRMFAKEANAASRAAGGSQFLDWIDSFYGKHEKALSEALGPAFVSLAAAGKNRSLVLSVRVIVDESKASLREAARTMSKEQTEAMLKQWPTVRAEQTADQILKEEEHENVAA